GAAVAVVIDKAGSQTTTTGVAPFTYNGSAQVGGSGTVTGAGGLNTSATVTYSANADGTGVADQNDAGTYSVTAHYAGDANHNASDGAAVAIVIGKAMTSTVGVASLATPLFGLDSVTFTATVSINAPGGGTLTGSVDFFDLTTSTDLGP